MEIIVGWKRRFILLCLFVFFGSAQTGAQTDSLSNLFRNAYSVFELLRNDKGIYRDSKVFNGTDFHPSSVASIGMGLISICIAEEMGWINDGAGQVITTLKSITGQNPFFRPDRNPTGYFRHWIDMNTGVRAWNSEYSTIDSGILLCGALFCQRYFCDNEEINNLVNTLWQSIDWSKAIQDPTTGGIYLEMLENGEGKENAITLPFNEYMIVSWLAMHQEKEKGISGKATQLWQNHYARPIDLPIRTYQGIAVLTDSPNHYLSSFVVQFPYYLCHYFSSDSTYLDFFRQARQADRAWWSRQFNADPQQWGLGAGSANNGSGYLATAINNNPAKIYSPQIIAGFLPVAPTDTVDLLNLNRNKQGLYTLPFSQNQILWRKSLTDPTWVAPEVQGVDYSTMLFGLASLPRFLGNAFFETYNDFFGTPCNQLTSLSVREKGNFIISLFPNPVQDEIQVSLENLSRDPLTIQMLNQSGAPVFIREINIHNSALRTSVDLSGMPAGIYFLKVRQRERIHVEKVIFQH